MKIPKSRPRWLLIAVIAISLLAGPLAAQETIVDRGLGFFSRDYRGHVMSMPKAVAGSGGTQIEFLVYSITAGGLLDIVRVPTSDAAERLQPGSLIEIPKKSIQYGVEGNIRILTLTKERWRTERGVPFLSKALQQDETALVVWRLRNSPDLLARFYGGDESARLIGFRPQLQEMEDALDSVERGQAMAAEIEAAEADARMTIIERDVESEQLLASCRQDVQFAAATAESILTGAIAQDRDVKVALVQITKLDGRKP